MDRQQILNLYQWALGICFRHPMKGDVPTAVIQTIRPRAGDEEPVRVCEDCVMELEQERWVEASRSGVDYRPGHVGEAPL